MKKRQKEREGEEEGQECVGREKIPIVLEKKIISSKNQLRDLNIGAHTFNPSTRAM